MGCCTSMYVSRDTFYPLVYVPSRDLDLPAPCLPSCRKANIFKAQMYEELVKPATKSFPSSILYGSYYTLSKYICRHAKDDIGKLWSIYCWVANLVPENIKTKDNRMPTENSPMQYMLRIRKKESLHAHVFAALVQSIDIPCVVITGVSKNAGYRLGSKVDKSTMISQWNAVFIHNEWRLVDTLWGAQCITGKRSNDWAIVDADGDIMTEEEKMSDGKRSSSFSEFFFLVDPDMLICTHLPNDPSWQMLPSAVTEEEFTSRVYIREQFFIMKCSFNTPEGKDLMLITKNGKVQIELGLPKKTSLAYDFKYLLFKDPESCPGLNNNDLQGTVFNETRQDLLSYAIQMPTRGLFRFDIFGVDVRMQTRFDLVASYLIQCDSPCPDFEKLPDSPEIGWGPGIECARMGLEPLSHTSSVIYCKDGRCQIRFKLTKQLTCGIEMKHNNMTSWELEPHAMLRAENGELQVDLRLPAKGQYAVKIYAKEGDGPGKLGNVCNYLVRNEGVFNGPRSFPYIHNGVVGKKVHICEHFGISPTSHTASLIQTTESEVPFNFDLNKDGVELLALLSGPKLVENQLPDIVSKNTTKMQVMFTLNMPDNGEYTLNVFARESGGKLIYPAQNYMVIYDPKQQTTNSPTSFGPQCETEAIFVNGMQMSTSYATANKDAVFACVEKSMHNFLPGGTLDSTVNVSQSGVGVNLTLDSIARGNLYKVDFYEELAPPSGLLVTKKSGRVLSKVEEEVEEDTVSTTTRSTKSTEPRPFNPVAMRARLKMVLVVKNLKFAATALRACRANHFVDDDLTPRVERLLEILQAQRDFSKALRKAMATNQTGPLEQAIDKVDELGLYKEMGFQVVVGRRILVRRLGEKIRKMDQTTVAEVKSYSAPPRAAMQVMKASLLLLGHSEDELKNWESMRLVIGETQKMKQRLKDVDVDAIQKDIALEAERLVTPFTHEDAVRVSDVVDAFYAWSKNMIKLRLD